MKTQITILIFTLSLLGINASAQNHQEIESPTADVLSLNSTGSSATYMNFLNSNVKRAYISTNGNLFNFALSNNNDNPDGKMQWITQGVPRMTMTNDGKFGIGSNITPSKKLDVDGQIRARGDVNADQFINLSTQGIKFDNGEEVNQLLPMFYAIYDGGSGSGSGPITGEVRLFAIVNFGQIPPGWIKCDGSLLIISNHNFLFTLLGSEYGGDGRTTFAVPDLRKAIPIQKP